MIKATHTTQIAKRKLCGVLFASALTLGTSAANANAAVSLTPFNTDFGSVIANGFDQSAEQVVIVENTGLTGTEKVTAIPTVSGSNFSITDSTCTRSFALTPGDACEVHLKFKPDLRSLPSEQYEGNFSIQLNNGSGNKIYTTSLRGEALAAQADTQAQSLLFPQTIAGKSSAKKSVLIKNNGNAPLRFDAFDIQQSGGTDAGQFTVDPDAGTCDSNGIEIAPGSSCFINIRFTPTSAGQKSAVLIVTTQSGIPANLVVTLNGEAAADPTQVDPAPAPAPDPAPAPAPDPAPAPAPDPAPAPAPAPAPDPAPAPVPAPDPGAGTNTNTNISTTNTTTTTNTETATGNTGTTTTVVGVNTGTERSVALSFRLRKGTKNLTKMRVRKGKKAAVFYTVNKNVRMNITVIPTAKKRKGKVALRLKKQVSQGNGKFLLPTRKLRKGFYRVVVIATSTNKEVRSSSFKLNVR